MNARHTNGCKKHFWSWSATFIRKSHIVEVVGIPFIIKRCLNLTLICIKIKDQNSSLRSSRPDLFCKKGVLRNLAKFKGKHLCQSRFFNEVAGLRPATSLKKRLWHRCFLVNFAKFHCNYFRVCFYHLFNRDMQLFEMVAFIIRIIWIFSNILLMFIYLKRFIIIANGLLLILYDSVSALKQFLSLTLLEVNNEGMCS